jgi:hypothetical protein
MRQAKTQYQTMPQIDQSSDALKTRVSKIAFMASIFTEITLIIGFNRKLSLGPERGK